MQDWLLQIWVDFRKTVIFVTYDVDEAVYLSDEICVMTSRPGRADAADHGGSAASAHAKSAEGGRHLVWHLADKTEA